MATNDYPEIRAALEARLATVAGLPPVERWSYENDAFEKPVRESWVWQRIHFGPEVLLSMPARGGYLQRNGTYRVVLYFPLDTGTADADALVQAVVDAFPVGTTLPNGGTTVRIDTPRRWGGGRDLEEGFYGVPIDIPWYVQRPNPLT